MPPTGYGERPMAMARVVSVGAKVPKTRIFKGFALAIRLMGAMRALR
jgi:hypothetical protein